MTIRLSGDRHINYHKSTSTAVNKRRGKAKDDELIPVGACITSNLKEEDPETEEDTKWNDAVDVLESVVLGHVAAGVDVAQPTYISGLEATLEKLEQHIYG